MGSTEDVREEFVELWSRMAGFWGIAPTTARVHGYLLSVEGGADAESIMSGVAMSRGAVSMATRELSDWGLVRTERQAGSRRVFYSAETDLERVVRGIVQTRKRREWDPILDRLREWIPRLEGEGDPGAGLFQERLKEIESVVASIDDMAESFLKGGLVQKLGLKLLIAKARSRGGRSRRRGGTESGPNPPHGTPE